jgi:hypothetical protein
MISNLLQLKEESGLTVRRGRDRAHDSNETNISAISKPCSKRFKGVTNNTGNHRIF